MIILDNNPLDDLAAVLYKKDSQSKYPYPSKATPDQQWPLPSLAFENNIVRKPKQDKNPVPYQSPLKD